jgi:hypothetical protein
MMIFLMRGDILIMDVVHTLVFLVFKVEPSYILGA